MEKREKEQAELEGIKQFYDGVYYAGGDDKLELSRHYFNLSKKIGVTSGQLILDVACGRGEWLKVNHQLGLKVAGVDLSDRAIETCKVNMPDGDFYAQPAETLPFDDNVFDVVTCLGSLEHFVDPVGSLKEMVRVAKPDAKFVILVPNLDFLTRKLGLFGGTYQVDAKEEVRTLEQWNVIFEKAGLTVGSRWKDLHVLSLNWIKKGKPYTWPIRAIQALMLVFWPLRWQYQVYHQCTVTNS